RRATTSRSSRPIASRRSRRPARRASAPRRRGAGTARRNGVGLTWRVAVTRVIGASGRATYRERMVGVSLVMDRVLPQRARARRWSNDGAAASYEATAHPGVEIAWIDA